MREELRCDCVDPQSRVCEFEATGEDGLCDWCRKVGEYFGVRRCGDLPRGTWVPHEVEKEWIAAGIRPPGSGI